MVLYSIEENWEILKTYFQSGESSVQTVRDLRKKMSKNRVPSRQVVDNLIKRARETGSFMPKTTRSRSRPVRSAENIATVAQSVREHPSTSTRHRSQELNISRTTLRRILHKDLGTTMSDTQKRPKVLVTHSKTPEAGIQLLRKKCEVIICEGLPEPSREEILTKSKDCDGILWATHELLNAEALDRAGPQLKVISTKSAGIDYVDVAEFKKRGIPLGYTPNVLSDAVADLAIGLMISAARRFHEGNLKIINNQWENSDPQWMLGQDIKGSIVGIVGLGSIGQQIAKRLKGFNVANILYTGHREKEEGKQLGANFVTFEELINRSDFVFVSCPLNNETKNLFNKAVFEKMKPNAVFINVARGGIVVQDDLIDALKNGTIFSAGLDVMTPEPLPADHPLTKLPNCVIIPHLGSATHKTRDNMAILAAQNVLNGIERKPLIYSAY